MWQRSTWMVIGNPIFRCMAESTRPFMSIPASTMRFGRASFRERISSPELSARILRAKVLLEDEVEIGDRLRVGTAEFIVTQPRMPCFKLGIRFERPDLVKRFLQSKRTGFYLAVQREGEVTAGDPIEFIERSESGVTILDITNLYALDSQSQELLRRATELPALPESWKDYFRKRLWNADAWSRSERVSYQPRTRPGFQRLKQDIEGPSSEFNTRTAPASWCASYRPHSSTPRRGKALSPRPSSDK